MLGSNNVFLTASLVARLSLGVSSDWEPAAHTTGPRGGNWSSAALFSARCLVTMSWQKHGERQMRSCKALKATCRGGQAQVTGVLRVLPDFSVTQNIWALDCLNDASLRYYI